MSSAVALVGEDPRVPLAMAVPEGRYRPALAIPSPEEVAGLKAYGEMIVASKLFPEKINTWQAAVMVVRYGMALGIDEFAALTQINWIKGVPSCSAQLMNSLILRDHGDQAIVPVVQTAEVCTLRCRRRGWEPSQVVEVSYTIGEARQAGLLDKTGSNWGSYPGDMLYARAVSRAGRRLFADTLRGLYTPEEIDTAGAVEATGYVVTPAGSPSPAPPPATATATKPAKPAAPSTEVAHPAPGDPQGQPSPSPLATAREDAARRTAEGRALQNAVLEAFKVRGRDVDEIAQELLRNRYWVADTRPLTAGQVREVREGLERWAGNETDYRRWLAMLGGVTTESMVVDAEDVLAEKGVNEPVILGALATRKERLAPGGPPQQPVEA